MKFYKIRHLPTGLFYKPSRGYYKENLSKRGKVYQEKRFAVSALNYIERCGIYTPEDIEKYGWHNPPVTRPKKGEFEIIEYDAITKGS